MRDNVKDFVNDYVKDFVRDYVNAGVSDHLSNEVNDDMGDDSVDYVSNSKVGPNLPQFQMRNMCSLDLLNFGAGNDSLKKYS